MIDIPKIKTFKVNQMYFLLLLLGILQYMLMFHVNIYYMDFRHDKVKQDNVPVLQEKKEAPPETDKNNKDMFLYQIKKVEPRYNPIILDASALHDVDLTMIKAIIMAESGYKRRSVSKHGARGLMQLMPGTAKALGVKDIFNPEENIHAGVRYYKSLLDRFDGDEKLALAAYNAGVRNVRKYKGIPPFSETKRYIKKVLAYRRFYRDGPLKKETAAL